jgi:hypothetical protein
MIPVWLVWVGVAGGAVAAYEHFAKRKLVTPAQAQAVTSAIGQALAFDRAHGASPLPSNIDVTLAQAYVSTDLKTYPTVINFLRSMGYTTTAEAFAARQKQLGGA